MASPDSTRNSQLLPSTAAMPACAPVMNTSSQENASTTAVRIAVARVESVFFTPIFARIAVTPANRAEAQASPSHIPVSPSLFYPDAHGAEFPPPPLYNRS